MFFFFFSSRRRHTRLTCDWSSDVCSSDLAAARLRGDRSVPPLLVLLLPLRGAAGACPGGMSSRPPCASATPDRESVGEGKRVEFGGRRLIKKKKNKEYDQNQAKDDEADQR